MDLFFGEELTIADIRLSLNKMGICLRTTIQVQQKTNQSFPNIIKWRKLFSII